jgi:hypothetical protein
MTPTPGRLEAGHQPAPSQGGHSPPSSALYRRARYQQAIAVRSRFAALPVCRRVGQPVLGAELNCSESRWLLFGARAAAQSTPLDRRASRERLVSS